MLKRIVLTGGPCAGKTTALVAIRDRVEKLGWRVILVPEAATLTFLSGGRPTEPTALYRAQHAILKTQLALEETLLAQTTNDQNTLLLLDRGALDCKAYMSDDGWAAVLEDLNLNERRLLHRNYDGVIHMVTAADGAESHYSLSNNEVRTESVEEAKVQDTKLKTAWLGHSHHKIIDNHGSFEDKIRRVLSEVCALIGEPEPLENERKFLVRTTGQIDGITSNIVQTYLKTEDGSYEERVRKRTDGECTIYTHAIKRPRDRGRRYETERSITGSAYLKMLENTDPNSKPIHKKRTCFLHNNRLHELDTYANHFAPDGNHLEILEIEVENIDDPIQLPTHNIQILREITGEDEYSNRALARLDTNTQR